MFREYLRAIRLEFSYIKESKVNLLFYFLLPALLIFIFGYLTQKKIAWLSGDVTYFDFYSPLILPTIILFIATQMSILRFVGERSPYGTLDRDLIAIPRIQMYLGKFTAFSGIAMLQCLVVWFITVYLFNVRHEGSTYLSLIFLILTAFFGIALGFFISVFAKSKEQAVQLVPFSILVLFILDIIVTMQSVNVFSSHIFQKLVFNLPLILATSSLTKVMAYEHTIVEVFRPIVIYLIWILMLILFGVVKFMFELRVEKKSVLMPIVKYAAVIIGLIFLVLATYPLVKPGWDRFSIDGFGLDEVSDQFNTYPYITDAMPMVSFIKKHMEIDVRNGKEYAWNIQGQKTEAIALVLEVKDKEELGRLSGREGSALEMEEIDGEQVYTYPIDVTGIDAMVYIWDEDKYLFVLAGPMDLGKNVARKAISNYPNPPTPSKFVPKKEDVNFIKEFIGTMGM